MQTVIGWLFGLRSNPGITLSSGGVTLREMSNSERNRILSCSQDFFARDPRIWNGCIAQFPLVFEKTVSDEFAFGGIDTVAVLLSLLAAGEIRTPVVWSLNEKGGGGSASSSQIIEYFYRFINGQFHTVDFEAISESASPTLEKLKFMLGSSPNQHMNSVLLDRIFESKRHKLTLDTIDSAIIARAADVCIGLESLYSEGPGEILFKLGTSIAWLLESDPLKREDVMKAIKNTYTLRSKVVHGSNSSQSPTKKEIESVICADRWLRRSVLTQLINKLDETAFKNAFKKARMGIPLQLDTAEWVKN